MINMAFNIKRFRLSAESCGILRSYQQDGELFRNAFQGCEFVDYLLEQEEITTREEAVLVGRRLLENDTIRHGTVITLVNAFFCNPNSICFTVTNISIYLKGG